MSAKKVLIIEDEKPLSQALDIKLRKQGYQVTVANDGKSGLALMAHDTYDVALLDLIMPVMDGFAVLSAARKLPAPPIFIVLSNLAQPQDTARCLALGARKFLIKSDTPLATIIKEIEAL
jgi:CheY-like chemotaxis protein